MWANNDRRHYAIGTDTFHHVFEALPLVRLEWMTVEGNEFVWRN
jgi:hypothetical protein